MYREKTKKRIPASLEGLAMAGYIPLHRLKVLIILYQILESNTKSARKRGRPKDIAVTFLVYELYDTLLRKKYGNYSYATEPGNDELIYERWTFSKDIAEVLFFLGIEVNDEQYYHTLLKRIGDIITVPPDGSKKPHRVYAYVVQVLIQPASMAALRGYCRTLLEPLAVYVPRLYEYLSNPAHNKHSKKNPTKKESMQRLKSLFCTDFFSE